jgi:hypothetical protein
VTEVFPRLRARVIAEAHTAGMHTLTRLLHDRDLDVDLLAAMLAMLIGLALDLTGLIAAHLV